MTAKIRWLTRVEDEGEDEGRSRWIHCTPLLGHNGAVGVWMVVLVDEEGSGIGQSKRRFRPAPPVSRVIGGKEYDTHALKEKNDQERTRTDELLPPRSRDGHRGHGPGRPVLDRQGSAWSGSATNYSDHSVNL